MLTNMPTYIHANAHMHTSSYTHAYTHMHTTHTQFYRRTCIHTCIHTHAYIHRYTNTHAHTYQQEVSVRQRLHEVSASLFASSAAARDVIPFAVGRGGQRGLPCQALIMGVVVRDGARLPREAAGGQMTTERKHDESSRAGRGKVWRRARQGPDSAVCLLGAVIRKT